MSAPSLSVVAPVHDEAAVLRELAARCVAAARSAGEPFEVILVDDASADETPAIAATLGPEVRVLRLSENRGQLGATLEGLRAARGERVVVLDGDLQDPPELIPALLRALDGAGPGVEVAFAVKTRRDDPAWFLAGRAAYGALARLGAGRPPSGAGSYCAMRRALAARAARVRLRHANLATVLAALGAASVGVPYEKVARYDGASRVGAAGLAREALGSLFLGGAVGRIATLGAVAAIAGAGLSALSGARRAALGLAVAGGLGAGAAVAIERRRRRALGEVGAAP